MGGKAIRDLTEEVTHLVAGEVGSQKYHVSIYFKIKKQDSQH